MLKRVLVAVCVRVRVCDSRIESVTLAFLFFFFFQDDADSYSRMHDVIQALMFADDENLVEKLQQLQDETEVRYDRFVFVERK